MLKSEVEGGRPMLLDVLIYLIVIAIAILTMTYLVVE